MAALSEIINALEYHPLAGDQIKGQKFDALRSKAIEFATVIAQQTPFDSREQEQAYIRLEEALMWAIKSVAIRDEPVDDYADSVDTLAEQAEQP